MKIVSLQWTLEPKTMNVSIIIRAKIRELATLKSGIKWKKKPPHSAYFVSCTQWAIQYCNEWKRGK